MANTNKKIPDLNEKTINKRIKRIRKYLKDNHIKITALPDITGKSYKTCTNIMNGFRTPSYIDTFLTAIEKHYSIN